MAMSLYQDEERREEEEEEKNSAGRGKERWMTDTMALFLLYLLPSTYEPPVPSPYHY